jgi:hypothetical protein
MDFVTNPQLRLRAGISLALMLLGALGFALLPSDSWLALFGLLASLGGLALFYRAVRFARDSALAGRRSHAAPAGRAYWMMVLARAALVLAMLVGAVAWTWFFGTDMNEVRLLLSSPHYVNAQIIGREIVGDKAAVGFVDYAYRVQPTLAPVDRFAVPHAEYPRFTIGRALEVTYADGAPRVHRIGHITWEYGVRRIVYWLLLLANGAAYLFLPLSLLRVRRRATAKKAVPIGV